MRDFLKSTRFKILLGFLAFLVGIMIYAVTKGGYSVSGASFINTITKPFRAASNGISMKMEGTVDKLSNADKYYEENQKLKKQIGELNAQLTEYDAIKAEVEELRKFVSIKEEHEDYMLSQPCGVLGYVTNDPFKSFTIDKGSADGILVNCPVVTAEGLVGITVEVSEHVSTVRTIIKCRSGHYRGQCALIGKRSDQAHPRSQEEQAQARRSHDHHGNQRTLPQGLPHRYHPRYRPRLQRSFCMCRYTALCGRYPSYLCHRHNRFQRQEGGRQG